MRISQQGNSTTACLEIISNRAKYYIQQSRVGCGNSKGWLNYKHEIKYTIFDFVFIFTSVPIKVGRTYSVASFSFGTHSWSISTSFLMHSISWSPSNVGKTERTAAWFIRSICLSGRNRRIFSSTPRKALKPSNN